jgi:predicted TPR repeat methyltransferase
MSTKFLNQAYGISTLDSRDLYTAWSDSYDKEVNENGYVTPLRVAEALDRHVLDKNTTVLDYGCGTGLSGQALLSVGFQAVDGVDVTSAMVDLAREKGIYRNLDVFSPEHGPNIAVGTYSVIAAIGVIGAGAAPLSVFDTIMDLLPTGGYFAFSFNDHTLEDSAYEHKVLEYTQMKRAQLVFYEYGAHLPGKDMKSNVYVLVKK